MFIQNYINWSPNLRIRVGQTVLFQNGYYSNKTGINTNPEETPENWYYIGEKSKFGSFASIDASNIDKEKWVQKLGPFATEIDLVNTDETISIRENKQGKIEINSTLSLFEEEFDISQNPSMIFTLNFIPTSIVGVFNDGHKLGKNYYEIISLNQIKVLPNPYDMGNIIINYYHKIN